MYVPVMAAIILTELFGPCAFFFLSRNRHASRNFRRYPTGLADSLGDAVFLAAFNGASTYLFLSRSITASPKIIADAVILAALVSTVFLYIRRDVYRRNDWSRPHRYSYALGGWYHQVFFFAQTCIVLFALAHIRESILLWFLAGYLTTVIYDIVTQRGER